MKRIRPPAVAGAFYPAQQRQLAENIDALLNAGYSLVHSNSLHSKAHSRENLSTKAPKAIIVPHAGYVYSGLTAATAYAELSTARDTIKRVVLLGPVHRVPVRGLALPDCDLFSTPLGEIEIDSQAVTRISALPQVVINKGAHAQEHSLEVQLPFLQRILNNFKLIPLAVGDATPQQVAEVLESLWGGDETLIVISSDLSHFLPYQTAQEVDAESVQRIMALDAGLNHQQACGGTPVNGLLLAAKQHSLKPKLLDLRNSADAADISLVDKARVVGYAAIGFYNERSIEKGLILLHIARAAIAQALGLTVTEKDVAWGEIAPETSPWLQEKGACFVTLVTRSAGQLRGCIGTLEAHRSLLEDIRSNAVAAALNDTRFTPLSAGEFADIQVEVSLLSATQAIDFSSEQQALQQLRPGIDGIVFEYGYHRSTFLPQVWEQLPESQEFMAHLKQKAGLAADFWSDTAKLSRYTVDKWKESDFE